MPYPFTTALRQHSVLNQTPFGVSSLATETHQWLYFENPGGTRRLKITLLAQHLLHRPLHQLLDQHRRTLLYARLTRLELVSSSVTGRPSIPIKIQSRIWGVWPESATFTELHANRYITDTIESVVGYRTVANGGILPLEPLRSSSCAIAFFLLVEPIGIEPMTSCLQSKRSPS